jgi:L-malate glycosyltransferase
MKICYLADGESVHTKRWCRFFKEAGHEINLITFKNVQIEGVKVHFVDAGRIDKAGGNWKIVCKYQKVKSLVDKIRPDILHAHYASSYGFIGALSGFHPYVISAYGSDVLVSPFRSRIFKAIVKYTLRKADRITSMADHMTEKLIQLGADKEKISNIIFGIDENIFNSANHRVPKDRFVITSTRFFEPVYNLPLLFNALKIVKNKVPGLQVNIVGEGTLQKEYEMLVSQYGINDVVTFKGRLLEEELVDVLNNTHVYITVSFSDGCSVSLLEALACGSFVIASDILPNKPWIKDGVNGFFVPVDNPEILAEKICMIYNKYRNYETACIDFNNKIISEKALWRKNMQKVQEIYDSLISGNFNNKY